MPQSSKESVLDMKERFQRLKQVEKTKYQCVDYANESMKGWSNYTPDEQASLALRLEHALISRKQVLRALYTTNVDESITSTAAFIFDRYLSKFAPDYIRGLVDAPHRFEIIGLASFVIAAKSQLGGRDLVPLERFLRGGRRFTRKIFEVELKILTALNWDVIYPSPISIIRELIELLSSPCGYQDFDAALDSFKGSILDEAAHITKLATVAYGFVAKFPPTTLALAALSIALENQRFSRNIAIFNLIRPMAHLAIAFERHELDLCFGGDDVTQCHAEMLNLLKSIPGRDADTKRQCHSPTKVTNVASL